MEYRHKVVFQQILQEALHDKKAQGRRRADQPKPFTWAEVSSQLKIGKTETGYISKRQTLTRFVKADIANGLNQTGRLFLDYQTAYTLWERLQPEISAVLKRDSSFNDRLFGDRELSNVIAWAYRCHESQLRKLIDEDGLETRYFCYKPSFRRRGNIVKSQFEMEPIEGEYIEVKEHQESNMEQGGTVLSEDSSGSAISKSGRIWIFMKEHKREQPRIFCLYRKEISIRKNKYESIRKISRIYGLVMESDMYFGNGVYSYRVCLVSQDADRESFNSSCKDGQSTYRIEAQINNVPYNGTTMVGPVFLDQKAVAWIESDLRRNGPDPDAGM